MYIAIPIVNQVTWYLAMHGKISFHTTETKLWSDLQPKVRSAAQDCYSLKRNQKHTSIKTL